MNLMKSRRHTAYHSGSEHPLLVREEDAALLYCTPNRKMY